MHVITVNAGCKLSSDVAIRAFLDRVDLQHPDWDCIFCPESCKSLESSCVGQPLKSMHGNVVQYTYYPGVGSHAMCWFLKSSLANSIVCRNAVGRTIAFSIKLAGCKTCTIVGVHAPHSEGSLREMYAHVSAQLRQFTRSKNPRSRFAFAIGDWNTDILPVHSLDHLAHVQNREYRHCTRRAIMHNFTTAQKK